LDRRRRKGSEPAVKARSKGQADKDILHTALAKRLGVERLETPKELLMSAGRGRATARRHFHFMSANARIEVGRMPDLPDLPDFCMRGEEKIGRERRA
jgi:hypothetical protein